MTRFAFFVSGPLLLLAALVTSGCASGRHLQSVTLTPPVADAQNFSNGQVPFVATGTYSKAPSPVKLTSKDVLWCVGSSDGGCVGNANPGATVDQNGVAQCNSGFVGTATVLAGTPSLVMGNPDSGPQTEGFRFGPVDLPLNSRREILRCLRRACVSQ